jgi:hypothetical protein
MQPAATSDLPRLAVVALVFATSDALGQTAEKVEVGARILVVTAGGEPANDIIATGIFARVRLDERWKIGAAVDRAEYDFEVPTRVLGLPQPPGEHVVDATVSSTSVSAWVEHEQGGLEAPLLWFWGGGLGVAFPEVDDAAGELANGGSFDITTDAGTEVLVSAFVGLRWRPFRHLSIELAARADHHVSEWTVTDRVSGRTGTTGDYTGVGGHFAIAYRF